MMQLSVTKVLCILWIVMGFYGIYMDDEIFIYSCTIVANIYIAAGVIERKINEFKQELQSGKSVD